VSGRSWPFADVLSMTDARRQAMTVVTDPIKRSIGKFLEIETER